MFSAASVCLFVGLCVCQHNNFRMSKHSMIKIGGRGVGALYKNLDKV